MARKCYDMPGGKLLHYPYAGGAWDQDELLMHLIGVARRTWEVFGFMIENKIKWSVKDADWSKWVTDDGND